MEDGGTGGVEEDVECRGLSWMIRSRCGIPKVSRFSSCAELVERTNIFETLQKERGKVSTEERWGDSKGGRSYLRRCWAVNARQGACDLHKNAAEQSRRDDMHDELRITVLFPLRPASLAQVKRFCLCVCLFLGEITAHAQQAKGC
ncbi:hypothetical protein WR25_03900 [Diploscapter pachys]|uniref:Uncharacterized protein n=1 Tax=Diploscapter pachys TaxID=2018661 RepID=A0A2A2JNC2_9BILA|nr:hypothetical protein WR25_03900 [Diploscapter pachys]